MLQSLLQAADAAAEGFDLSRQILQGLLADQYAGLIVGGTHHPQPTVTYPHSVTGDHRLLRAQARTQAQSLIQILGDIDTTEQAVEAPRRLHLVEQADHAVLARCARNSGLGIEQIDLTLCQALQPGGHIVHIRHAHRLQGVSQGDLHRPLPTGFYLELLCQTHRVMETVLGQPRAHGAAGFAQGLFLQGLQRGMTPLGAVQFGACRVEFGIEVLMLLALRIQAFQVLIQGGLQGLQRCIQLLFGGGSHGQFFFQRLG